jgi:hypothetical protein
VGRQRKWEDTTKAIKEIEKLQESDADGEHVEDAISGQIKELGNKLIEDSDKEKLEASFHGHIKELEKKLQERDADK